MGATKRKVDGYTDVLCPFYHDDEGVKIRCEGFCKNNCLQISFQNREQMLNHRYIYCMSFDGFPSCPLYSVIYKQYEG